MADSSRQSARLHHLDWMRGLAVVFMMEFHTFDSFLSERLRTTEWYWISRFLGGLAAPLFLFITGLTLALALERLRSNKASTIDLAALVCRRAGWILVIAYAFRLEQFLVWYPYAPWSDLFRVDILNCIAVSMLAAGLSSAWIHRRTINIVVTTLLAVCIVLLTPWVYQVTSGVPSFLLAYINGAGHSHYFTFFYWSAFTFSGMAFGYFLVDARSRGRESEAALTAAMIGISVYGLAKLLDAYPVRYGVADYVHTSPQYFLARLGCVFLIFYAAYKWALRRTSERWSPLETLGRSSLLIYWVHIEFIYGRVRPFRNSLDVGTTAAQLLWLIPLMLALAVVREHRLKPALQMVRLFRKTKMTGEPFAS